MFFLGFIGALIIGLVLGLIGGGGSILTVPIFVYFLDINPILATAYSLFVVGITALVGALRNLNKNLIEFRTGFVFAIPSFVGVYIARAYLLELIPEKFIIFSNFFYKETAIMIFFAIIMLLASYFMIRGHKQDKNESIKNYNSLALIVEGFIVGILTGIVGAGGGFLIIPALVLFAKLPMKKAVATSLLIIAIKSLFGFLGDLGNSNLIFDWQLLSTFTLLSIVGIFIGVYFTNFIDAKNLKKGFGLFVFTMSIIIIIKEFV